ncbi:hypothetical protein BU16DRAFT_479471 [Lophium mytilinum]|uniref:Phytanoyl-CoA dioxygenase family protein n=1 Tax=Lophium mytilinum TaxID=390894 RepID=A0A6A6R859_9PEZI|nr:hypothetical protein BU16DRAFT_479471 [Lophium mytilinum]
MPSQTSQPFTSLPYDSTTVDDIVAAFDRDGAVILSDFASPDAIRTLNKELGLSSSASPSAVTALASKSRTFVYDFLKSPKLLQFLDAKLQKTTRIWHGEERLSNTSRPQLSATVVFDSAPGSQAEPLHRHDDIYFAEHPLSQPVEIWALWSGSPEGNTTENGCVEGIIGSHTWGEDWDPAGHVLASTEMKTGSCLLLHGSLVHRGGANQSRVLRRSIGASWTQGHLRQEENQYLNISKEKAMSLDEPTQRLIGYKINAPMGGWYELRDPITYLARPDDKVDTVQREFRDEDVVG